MNSHDSLKYDERGLIPCVVQQYDTGEVLMVAWMNKESIELTLTTGTTWFWSRSRNELWNKGATSGNMQRLIELRADCDSDTLLALVDSPGPACHTGARSCFFKQLVYLQNDSEDAVSAASGGDVGGVTGSVALTCATETIREVVELGSPHRTRS